MSVGICSSTTASLVWFKQDKYSDLFPIKCGTKHAEPKLSSKLEGFSPIWRRRFSKRRRPGIIWKKFNNLFLFTICHQAGPALSVSSYMICRNDRCTMWNFPFTDKDKVRKRLTSFGYLSNLNHTVDSISSPFVKPTHVQDSSPHLNAHEGTCTYHYARKTVWWQAVQIEIFHLYM